jgi:hypothetical protein
MAKALGRAINVKASTSVRKGVKIARNLENITHQQFIDDTILYGGGHHNQNHSISGQLINNEKSKIFFFQTRKSTQKRIIDMLDFNIDSIPNDLLGVPLLKGAITTELQDDTFKACKIKSEAWKGRWLTLLGRIMMIKVVLSAIPIYMMSCLQLMKKSKYNIEEFLKTFLWEGPNKIKRMHLISWDTFTKSKNDGRFGIRITSVIHSQKVIGGSGIRITSAHNTTLGAKWVWRIFENPSSL